MTAMQGHNFLRQKRNSMRQPPHPASIILRKMPHGRISPNEKSRGALRPLTGKQLKSKMITGLRRQPINYFYLFACGGK
jgi:hypothetical protein